MQKEKKKHLQPMLMFKMPTAEGMRDEYINTRQDNSLGGGGEIKKSHTVNMEKKVGIVEYYTPFTLRPHRKAK